MQLLEQQAQQQQQRVAFAEDVSVRRVYSPPIDPDEPLTQQERQQQQQALGEEVSVRRGYRYLLEPEETHLQLQQSMQVCVCMCVRRLDQSPIAML